MRAEMHLSAIQLKGAVVSQGIRNEERFFELNIPEGQRGSLEAYIQDIQENDVEIIMTHPSLSPKIIWPNFKRYEPAITPR